MFLVPQVPIKYRLRPSRFFGIRLVPQVSKPDKFGPKPDFEYIDQFWPPQNRPMNSKFEKKTSKKSEIFWGRICLHARDANKISGSFGTRGARGKKKTKISAWWIVNSKKIKTKSKNYQTFWGPICLSAQGATKILSWNEIGRALAKILSFFWSFFFKFTIHRAVLWRSNPVNMLKIWFRTKLNRFWDLRDQMYTKKIWGIMSILCGNLRDQKHTFLYYF